MLLVAVVDSFFSTRANKTQHEMQELSLALTIK